MEAEDKESFQKVVHCFKDILTSPLLENEEVNANWTKLVRGYVDNYLFDITLEL